MENFRNRLANSIRNIDDFPKPGIKFKDITPILLDASLCNEIAEETLMSFRNNNLKIDAICAIESRGYFIGMLLAQKLGIPLIPIRKAGKLPAATRAFTYELEYGTSTLEIHKNVIKPDWNVLIHDDLLATGGTAVATAELVKAEGGLITGFSFIIELDLLNGREKLLPYSQNILSLSRFQ
ncbi:MAG: adenine phosphoribosyltransferase [Bacteroidia bacterium]|nr:adenine phosphoribosyltransferase [Bacteroidia bacterium]